MSRVLYWDCEEHSLYETGEKKVSFRGVEFVIVQPAEFALRYAVEGDYDLFALHHNDSFTLDIAQRVRAIPRHRDTLIVGVTGAIRQDKLAEFKKGLGENTVFDEFIVRRNGIEGTFPKLVQILESVEAQRNA